MWHTGRRIAPPRFVLFVLVFAAGLPALVPAFGPDRGIMAAFDIAAIAFLLAATTLLRRGQAEQMRAAARCNDANRVLLLVVTAAVTLTVLVAVYGELKARGDHATVTLVVATLALAWLFSNLVYAFHYAHLYYSDGVGGDAGGLEMPGDEEPDYWDFLYFSYTLGMTFQTSDVTVRSGAMRRVVLGHCLVAFVFNLGVVAFTVNVLGGG